MNIIDELAAVCGSDNIVDGAKADDKYLRDFLRQREGRALAVVTPQNTTQVSELVKICAKHHTPIVPQGGNTSYRAASIPDESGRAVVFAMEKMNSAPEILPTDVMYASAGCTLQSIQDAAEKDGRFFPLDIGAKGSCQIGGNLSTNAGGLNFLRYGGARELCLGIEAVLPDGRIMRLPGGARKNNSGYDLKHLLIGGEGTLGIITAAWLRVYPPPRARAAAFAAVDDIQSALSLLEMSGELLESCEVMPRNLMSLLSRHCPQSPQPFAEPPPLAVLLEAAGDDDIGERLNTVLSAAIKDNIIKDAVLPSSESQRRAFWQLRELAPEATKREGKWIKLDVCLPLPSLAEFVTEAEKAAGAGSHIIAFGHLGDGNLHLSLRPKDCAPEDNPKLAEEIKTRVLDLTHKMGGAFSAEHGIGRTNIPSLLKYGDPAAIAAMRAVKTALDPHNIMNPGVLLGE